MTMSAVGGHPKRKTPQVPLIKRKNALNKLFQSLVTCQFNLHCIALYYYLSIQFVTLRVT